MRAAGEARGGPGRPDGRDGGRRWGRAGKRPAGPSRPGAAGGRKVSRTGRACDCRPAGLLPPVWQQVIRRFDAVWIEFLTLRADIQMQHSVITGGWKVGRPDRPAWRARCKTAVARLLNKTSLQSTPRNGLPRNNPHSGWERRNSKGPEHPDSVEYPRSVLRTGSVHSCTDRSP